MNPRHSRRKQITMNTVIPAQAGIPFCQRRDSSTNWGSRLRGNDVLVAHQ
jgi:hypothetical protein